VTSADLLTLDIFFCAFELIFVYCLLSLFSLVRSHFWFLFHFKGKNIFNLRAVWLPAYALYSAFHLQTQEIDRSRSKFLGQKVGCPRYMALKRDMRRKKARLGGRKARCKTTFVCISFWQSLLKPQQSKTKTRTT